MLARRRDVADILTALRGPDTNPVGAHRDGMDVSLKYLTSCRLRALALGLNLVGYYDRAAWGDSLGWMLTPVPLDEAYRRTRDALLAQDQQRHFAVHYRDACEAAGRVYGYDLKCEAQKKRGRKA